MEEPVIFDVKRIIADFIKSDRLNNNKMMMAAFDNIIGLTKFKRFLNKCYDADDFKFTENAIRELKLKINLKHSLSGEIPAKGPCLIIANHPHGLIDGLICLNVCSSIRRDIKIVVNHSFKKFGILSNSLIYVDPYREEGYEKSNYEGVRRIKKCLENQEAVVLFPAGDVSYFHFLQTKITDKKWDASCVKFLSRLEYPLLPLHINGRNSWIYQIGKVTHKKIGLSMFINEFFKQKNKEYNVSIKNIILKTDIQQKSLDEYEKSLREVIYLS